MSGSRIRPTGGPGRLDYDPSVGHSTATLRTGRLRAWLIGFVLLASLGVLWSLATPVFAAPDESAHAAKAIAVVRGELLGSVRDDVQHLVTPLPDGYRFPGAILCFAFHPEVPASCGVALGDPSGTDWFGNWVARYNPLYYVIVGWPSLLFEGSAGILAMRVVSALLSSAVLALVVPVLLRPGARWTPMGLAFLLTPMVAFFIGTINPQSTEIAGGLVVLVSLIRILERYRDGADARATRWLWGVLIVGTVFLANSRSLGPVWWLVLAALAVAFVGWRSFVAVLRDRGAWWWIVAIGAISAASAAWTAAAGVFAGQASESDNVTIVGPAEGVLLMLRLTPDFLEQSVAKFGWLDTAVPAPVLWAFFAVAFLLVTLSLTAAGRRGRRAALLATGVALLLPIVVQSATITKTGLIWQGRYGLVFSLGALLVAAWALSTWGDRRVAFLSVRLTTITAVVLALVHFASFIVALHRYVVGVNGTIAQMLADPQWQPPGTWPVLVAACGIVLLAWVVVIVVAARRTGEHDDAADPVGAAA